MTIGLFFSFFFLLCFYVIPQFLCVCVHLFYKLSFIYFVYFVRVFNSVYRKFQLFVVQQQQKSNLTCARKSKCETVQARASIWGESESERTLSLSYRSSRCDVIKLFTWVWPKSIIELILCFLFGAARSWHIDCSPRNFRFLSVYLTFSRVSSVYEAQKVFLYIHT